MSIGVATGHYAPLPILNSATWRCDDCSNSTITRAWARCMRWLSRWPAALAYVIATSGTTDMPNLVGVSHHAVVNCLAWCAEEYTDAGRAPAVRTSLSQVQSKAMPTVSARCVVANK